MRVGGGVRVAKENRLHRPSVDDDQLEMVLARHGQRGEGPWRKLCARRVAHCPRPAPQANLGPRRVNLGSIGVNLGVDAQGPRPAPQAHPDLCREGLVVQLFLSSGPSKIKS